MSLESFYGGRQGISPVIKTRFRYVDENDAAYLSALSLIENGDYDSEEKSSLKEALLTEVMDYLLADTTYEDVWYNELCIIDTLNKSNPNNGKLFRRTLKGAGDTELKNRSAEYIGRIVGPAGANPFFSIGNLNSVKDIGTSWSDISVENTYVGWPTDANGSMSTSIENIDPYILIGNVDNSILVPGQYKQGGINYYNDDIKYTWLNIVDDRSDVPTMSKVYMGFQVPYSVFDIEVNTNEWTDEIEIEKQTGSGYDEHPFYNKWNIDIPRGIRGNAAGNIRLAQYKDFSNLCGDSIKPFLYDFAKSVETLDDKSGKKIIRRVSPDIRNDLFKEVTIGEEQSYNPTEENWYELINNDYQLTTDTTVMSGKTYYQKNIQLRNNYIFVYTYVFYNKELNEVATAEEYDFYIGKYDEIDSIDIDAKGVVTVKHSDTTVDTLNTILQWVDNIEIDNNGEITFTYNTIDVDASRPNEHNFYSTFLPYPLNLYIDHDGIITVQLHGPNIDSEPIEKQLILNWTKDWAIVIPEQGDNPSQEGWYEFVNGVAILSSDTDIVNGKTYYEKDKVINEVFGLNYVNSITMDDTSKALGYKTYPNEQEFELNNGIGINYLQASTVDKYYHLLVFHSSSQFRPSQEQFDLLMQYLQDYQDWQTGGEQGNPPVYTGEFSSWENNSDNVWYVVWKGQTFRNGYPYGTSTDPDYISASDFWQDLGKIRDVAYGVKVKAAFSFKNPENPEEDLLSEEQQLIIADYSPRDFIDRVLNPRTWSEDPEILNPYYQGNIPGTDNYGNSLRGWFIYASQINSGSLFYYDYSYNTWAYAGSWSESTNIDVKIKHPDGTYNTDQELSSIYGIIFNEKATYDVIDPFAEDDEDED